MTNTLFVGKVYYRFDKLPSTNDHAQDLIAKSRPAEGTVVRAAMQTAGRGQYGSRWESAAGENLTLSVIFYPGWLPPTQQFRLSMAVALALRATVEASLAEMRKVALDAGEAPEVTIKWPNDIYINDKKTAGILIQNSLSGNQLANSVVGIGLNVNQTVFPAELTRATSLAASSSLGPFDLEAVAEILFGELEQQYLALRAGNALLETQYLAQLYRFGVTARYRRVADGRELQATITGISETGRLVLESDHGVESFDIKEIIFL